MQQLYQEVSRAADSSSAAASSSALPPVPINLSAIGSISAARDGSAEGDGITPIGCAHLEGAEQREVDAFHIGFVPGSGTRLLGTPWYGTPGVLEGWADFLQ